jgi:putative ABC transport system permease protein
MIIDNGSKEVLKNYLLIAVRNLRKSKVYSVINMLGLAIGLGCAILILSFIQNELSVNDYHVNRSHIVEAYLKGTKGENTTYQSTVSPCIGPMLKAEYPEVMDAVRIYNFQEVAFQYQDRLFLESNGIAVDSNIFDLFTFPFVSGDPKTALAEPHSMVITRSMAEKYFGNNDPINKKINVEGKGFLVVGGVIKDIPANSHLQFDYAVPYVFLENVPLCGLHWADFSFKTYVQLNQPADLQAVQEKMTQISINNDCPQIKYGGMSFSLQSLNDMYLHPVSNYDMQLGDIRYIYIFSAVALLILAIACINFINLSTARAMTRAKEVSIRKVVGANRRQIVLQLWSEFMLFAGMALGVALAAVQLAIPYFNQLTGKQLQTNFLQPHMLALIFIALVGCGVLAGLYPAISISLFQPVKLLQKQSIAGSNSPFLRRLLVIGQFSLSILLIICTLVVSRQMNYIQNKSWNLKDDLVLHMPIKKNIGIKFDVVKNQLLQHPNIVAVSAKDALPTTVNNNTTGVWWTGKTAAQDGLHVETIRVSHDYFASMGLDLVAGRTFSREHESDLGGAYILNEEAVRYMGLTDPVGKEFAAYGKRGAIIGVVEDSYFQTMKQPKRPQAYYLFSNLPYEGFFGSVFVRIADARTHAELQAVISHIKSVWNSVNRMAPFEYHFLDQTIQAQYRNEERLMQLFGIFSTLAIVVSCLGLFGLSTFVAERRTKEIGIRKVLGSTVYGIVMLLSRSFAKWVLVANIIAWPVAWYAMNKWLQDFAYRIDMSWWMFVLSGGIALVIALATVSWQAVKAATANPVDSLRYE